MNKQTNNPGKLIVISAPSGAGKTTLVKALCESDPELMVSVSHTTRPRRDGEEDGIAYHFTNVDTFQDMVDGEQFLEHAKVFDNYYGTSRPVVESQLAKGIDVILEIDWQGARRVRQMMPESQSIFILPPSYQALETRLTGRGKDDAKTIQRRMDDAINELSHYREYDYLVINDDLELALSELQGLIAALRDDQQPQQADLSEFVTRLMAKNQIFQ